MEEMKEAFSVGKHRNIVQEQPENSSGQFCTLQELNKCCIPGSQQITSHFILAGSEVLSVLLLDSSSGT
jgi:hypothetical protein